MSEFSGQTIGQYQLVEIIDETGTALVYKGFQPSMNRYVAVKVLKPGAARHEPLVQQFIQQGELVARMQHPTILTVYDTGRQESVVYRAMQYVQGGALRDRLYEFQDARQALGLISGLTEGLEYIHSQGYVHGNLKPSNILLDENKRPLLTDFGMPSLPGEPPTPYKAPEQVQGGVVDRRSDVYALGVLLYEMLVGEAPPPGAVASPRARRPDLPEAVERVVLKAMAQNPDARFQSAAEFRNALDAALRPVAPPPQPVQPQPQAAAPVAAAPPPQKKGPNWPAIVMGILLVIVIGACALLLIPRVIEYFAGETPQPSEPPIVEVTVIPPTREERPTREPRPTRTPPPEQPTEPPEEIPPTEPPEGEGPPEGGGPELPDICGSAGILVGAVALVGATSSRKRKRRS